MTTPEFAPHNAAQLHGGIAEISYQLAVSQTLSDVYDSIVRHDLAGTPFSAFVLDMWRASNLELNQATERLTNLPEPGAPEPPR